MAELKAMNAAALSVATRSLLQGVCLHIVSTFGVYLW